MCGGMKRWEKSRGWSASRLSGGDLWSQTTWRLLPSPAAQCAASSLLRPTPPPTPPAPLLFPQVLPSQRFCGATTTLRRTEKKPTPSRPAAILSLLSSIFFSGPYPLFHFFDRSLLSLHVPSIYTLVCFLETPQHQSSEQQSSPRPTYLFLSTSAILPIVSSPISPPLRHQVPHQHLSLRSRLIHCSVSVSLHRLSRTTRFL